MPLALATWTTALLVVVACALVAVALFAGIRRLLNGSTRSVAQSVIRDPEEPQSAEAAITVAACHGCRPRTAAPASTRR